ncbi:hypothetical protein HanHA89_Chr01g0012971 [Helianthus annuus]|nr:hypothetical protein HanHA89_Chr01g0012971 [Helianthus annuus]
MAAVSGCDDDDFVLKMMAVQQGSCSAQFRFTVARFSFRQQEMVMLC